MRALGLGVLVASSVASGAPAKPTVAQATKAAQSFISDGTAEFFSSPDPTEGLKRFAASFEAAGWGTDWTCDRGVVTKQAARAGAAACVAGHMPGFVDWAAWSDDAPKALTPHLAAIAADLGALTKTATVVWSVNHLDATSTNATVFAFTLVKGKPKIAAVFVEQSEKPAK